MKNNQRIATPYYHKLKRNMILIVIIVSFTPMILVGGVILSQFQSSYEEKIQAHLQELVEKHKQNIDTFLTEKLSDIRYLAKAYTYQELSNKAFLEKVLEALQKDYGPVFDDLGAVDAEGNLTADAVSFKLGKAYYAEAEWFHKALRLDP